MDFLKIINFTQETFIKRMKRQGKRTVKKYLENTRKDKRLLGKDERRVVLDGNWRMVF